MPTTSREGTTIDRKKQLEAGAIRAAHTLTDFGDANDNNRRKNAKLSSLSICVIGQS